MATATVTHQVRFDPDHNHCRTSDGTPTAAHTTRCDCSSDAFAEFTTVVDDLLWDAVASCSGEYLIAYGSPVVGSTRWWAAGFTYSDLTDRCVFPDQAAATVTWTPPGQPPSAGFGPSYAHAAAITATVAGQTVDLVVLDAARARLQYHWTGCDPWHQHDDAGHARWLADQPDETIRMLTALSASNVYVRDRVPQDRDRSGYALSAMPGPAMVAHVTEAGLLDLDPHLQLVAARVADTVPRGKLADIAGIVAATTL